MVNSRWNDVIGKLKLSLNLYEQKTIVVCTCWYVNCITMQDKFGDTLCWINDVWTDHNIAEVYFATGDVIGIVFNDNCHYTEFNNITKTEEWLKEHIYAPASS